VHVLPSLQNIRRLAVRVTVRLPGWWLTVAALLAAPGAANAEAAQLSGTGTVEYHLVHKFHKVVGKSRSMAVRGTVDDSGLKAMARAQVASFDSANTNRDQHMLETLEASRHPWVSVRVALPGFKLPTSATSTKIMVASAVELHGVTVSHPIELRVETRDGTHLQVSFEFTESLTAHRIERPSLLFVPVDDFITIVGKVDLTVKK
jgi:hypothetical protein